MNRISSRAWRSVLVLLPGVVGIAVLLARPPILQDPAYHQFVDRRTVLGIPYFGDVITNVAFLLVGLAGLWFLARRGGVGPDRPFAEASDRRPYWIFYAGLTLTALGSGWYHLNPGNDSIVWDRLPLTLVFMSLFAAVIGEHVGPRWGARLLPFLLAAGAGSVVVWHLGERAGAGDLRFYAVVQFYPMMAIPLILLLYRSRYTHAGHFWGVLGWYALAKGFEMLDGPIYGTIVFVSGHNLKHVAAALSAAWILRMLDRRKSRPAE
jgi:hypothetical protein